MPDSTLTVFRNGPVFTSDAARSWATAVAVQSGAVVAVGGDHEVAPYLGKADDVVDLAGRLLIPGFIDAHVHPVMGGLERMRCDLTGGSTIDDYTRAVTAYVSTHPDREWVLGGGWSMDAFPNGRPTADLLDHVTSRPVFLPNRDHHSAWVSSSALALAGITADTPDPADGRIERDASGNPTGLLHEGAMDLVESRLPTDTQADYDAALRLAQAYLHSVGIVGWQDAWVKTATDGPNTLDAYRRADQDGWLTARVAGALWWERDCGPDGVADQVAHLARIRAEVAGERFRAGHVKVMQDGVVETFTAALVEPYLDRCGHPTTNSGLSFLTAELLSQVTVALDAAGFDVHFHALGDRAVRDVLDALTAARAANGSADRRHQLAHLQVVQPDDIRRFRELGAAANLQALWACHEPQMDDLAIPFLGQPRATWQYPFGDLHRDGATLVMGSDWPVSSPVPLEGIHVAVNRIRPGAHDVAAFEPSQTLPLPVALAAYTAGSAWASRLDDRSGRIVVGQRGDVVVLDRDPFDHPRTEIGDVSVARTYVDGVLVHHDE